MDALQTTTAIGLVEAEGARRDSGVVFLVGMAVAGLLAVFATLSLVDTPAGAGTGTGTGTGTTQPQVSPR